MLPEEASWIRRQLERIDPAAMYPMCNLGSSTLHYRTVMQPYIDEELFARARGFGRKVVHVDMKVGPGVDVAGDYSDTEVAARLRAMDFKSVMCCNMLEHVTDRQALADLVVSLVRPGGFLIVTVPREFPYHEDPIDTMFRPDISQVVELFKGTELVSARVVRASRFVQDMGGNWRPAFRLAVRVCVPFYHLQRWAGAVHYAWQLWRGYRVTCVILRRRLQAAA